MDRSPGAPGLFIVLEGVDGSGKSTQVASVAAHLRARGRDVVTTREPGGTAVGTALRELLLESGGDVDAWTEVLLYAADRAQHVAELVRPAIEGGRDVVSDRFLWSSLAYQGVGRRLGSDEVAAVNLRAVEGLTPDLVVVLDVPHEVARGRLGAGRDRIEAEPRDFHERVRRGFLDLALEHGAPVVDASRDLDVVSKEILAVVDGLLAEVGA